MTRFLLPVLSFAWILNATLVQAQETKPEPLQPFLFASAQGRIIAVERMLEKGTNINAVNRAGLTALHLATVNNYTEVAALLLKHGADLEKKANDGRTPLNVASEKGSMETAKLLLDQGAEIDARMQFRGKMTSLSMALHKNFIDLALMLVQRGADVTLKNEAGVAPMDIVIERRFDNLFWPVFNAAKQGSAQNKKSLAAYLDIAVSLDNLNLFKTILEEAPQLSTTNGNEMDLFFKAAGCGSRTTLDYFLGNGRRLDEIMPESKWSPLHFFARENNLDLINFGLDEGILVDVADTRQWTPLHIAARLNHIEGARLLLKKGASPEARDESGSTPLHLAAAQGHTMIIRLLMAQGASPVAVTNAGRTPLDIALFAGHHHLRNVFPLGTATVGLSDFDYTGTILQLRKAVLNGHSRAVNLLLQKTDTNFDQPDRFGMTLLHYAADHGNAEITTRLLNAGVQVNIPNPYSGWTPLLHAANGDHSDVAKLLMMSGADVNAQDVRGWTALHIALFTGNEELSDALRVAGARDDLKNNDGQLPEDLAGARATFIQAQERGISRS